jgi:hypothetical protein
MISRPKNEKPEHRKEKCDAQQSKETLYVECVVNTPSNKSKKEETKEKKEKKTPKLP